MTTIYKRHAKAATSSNLKCDTDHHDTDVLAAVALSSEFGSLLFRVKFANDPTSYSRMREEWRWHVKKHAAVMGWPENIRDDLVADQSLKYWMNNLCRICGGKGKKKMEFVEILSDDPCEFCNGTGKAEIQCNRHIKKYVWKMAGALDGVLTSASVRAVDKLNHDGDQ